jgi:hypothetical protein
MKEIVEFKQGGDIWKKWLDENFMLVYEENIEASGKQKIESENIKCPTIEEKFQ